MTTSKAGRRRRTVGGAGGVSATLASSSVVSISPSPGGGWTEAGPRGAGSFYTRLGRAGHEGSVAGWSSPQFKLAQWGGEAEQQPATGRRLPSLGQVGLGQRCSAFL